MPATDAQAAAAGFNIPTDDNTLVSAIPSIIRQNARASAPSAWVPVTNFHANLSNIQTEAAALSSRLLGDGTLQIAGGRRRTTGSITRDSTLFRLTTAHRPPYDVWFGVSGQLNYGASNVSGHWTCKIEAATGNVVIVEALATDYYLPFSVSISFIS